MRHIFIVLLLLIIIPFKGKAQVNPLDSLQQLMRNAPHDSVKCRLLLLMVDAQNDEKIWPNYYKEVIQICSKYCDETKLPNTKSDTVFLNFLASAYDLKGYHFQILGDVKSAITFLNKSLNVSKKINSKQQLASTYNNLAGINSEQGDLKTALKYFNLSLETATELKDKYFMAKSFGNIATCYDNLGDTALATKMYLKAAELFGEVKDFSGQILIYNNLAGRHNVTETSLFYYLKAYDLSKKVKDMKGLSFVAGNIGYLYRKLNKIKLAYKYSLEAYKAAYDLGYPNIIKPQALNMFWIERERGNFKSAIEYQTTFYKMRDSIRNLDVAKEAMNQQMNFEYEKQKTLDDVTHAKELELGVEREKRQSFISIMVGVGLVIVILFLIFVFLKLKETRRQKGIIELQKKEVDQKNEIIETKQKEILDSILYAKRIQNALLAHEDVLNELLPNHFVYFKPKDIVSGDFYWATKKGDKFYLAVCDSTGHGVPGAFMSLLNIGFINEAINEKGIERPNEVFDFVRQRLIDNISKDGQKDGFDGILLCFQSGNERITYAAANNASLLTTGDKSLDLDYDRMPVGIGENLAKFTLFELAYAPGDLLYLYTDGFADQFGGPKGKKFMSKKLKALLNSFNLKPINEQQTELNKQLEKWQGNLEQVDDICVLGLRL